MTKEETVTLRLTKPERADLDAAATLTGQPPGTLAAIYVKEGVRRSRFAAIEFRDGSPWPRRVCHRHAVANLDGRGFGQGPGREHRQGG